MRKLATIRKIDKIENHPNADRLSIATIDGWTCVVAKDQFKENDKVVYIECDSILPDNPIFEQAKKYAPKKVKIAKLRGVVSQGLVYPLDILPLTDVDLMESEKDYVYVTIDNELKRLNAGDDVSDLLGITLWEPPVPKDLKAKGNWPSFLQKTDSERIANATWLLEKYKGVEFYASLKMDGCLDQDTALQTVNGDMTIKDICEKKYNGKVLSYNLKKNILEFDEIIGHRIKNGGDWYELELESGRKLKVTGNHLVWLPTLNCYRRVDMLEIDDEVLMF